MRPYNPLRGGLPETAAKAGYKQGELFWETKTGSLQLLKIAVAEDYICIVSHTPKHRILSATAKSLLLLLLCTIATLSVSAQRYSFFNLSIENGLVQSQAVSLAQDSDGHLWIGTQGGLSRYDGHSFTNYTVRDGLLENTITCIAIDAKNRLWIGGQKGLSLFNGKTFRHFLFQAPELPRANAVQELHCAGTTAWCLVGGNMYTVQDNGIKPYKSTDTRDITAICPMPDNTCWATRSGSSFLYRYHGSVVDSTLLPAAALEGTVPYVIKCFSDNRGRLWLLTSKGLFRATGTEPVTKTEKLLQRLPPVRAMAQAKDGSYWIALYNGGAIRFTDTTAVLYNKQNGLTDNPMSDVLADREGNIWLASDGQGIFRFSGAPFTALDESMGLHSAEVMGLAYNGRSLYIGTYDGGLYTYEQHKLSPVPGSDSIVPSVTSLVLRNNELWIGTRDLGLWSYANGQFKQYPTAQYHFPSSYVSYLKTDTAGKLWIGFVKGGMIYDGTTFSPIPLRGETVQSMAAIGTDSMLIATEGGLRLYHNNIVQPFTTRAAPDSASAQCLLLHGRDLWIGTSDNGAICYNLNTGKATIINRSNGLLSDFVYNLCTDATGNIWAGTGNGIYKIGFPLGHLMVSAYGKAQGVTGMESSQNAVCPMPDGSIWFGTNNGALHYNPQAIAVNPQPVSLVLQSVRLYGEDIDTAYYTATTPLYNVPEGLRLPYRKNNLTFTFNAISLSGSENIVYRYRIEGLDHNWSEWSKTNTVNYSAMPSGQYTFRLQCSTDGIRVAKELSYSFEIITPFQKTGLFRLIILGICILLGVSLQYLANRRKLARLRLIEKLRREEQHKIRERTAEDFHDEVGNKLTRINVLTNVLQGRLGQIPPEAARILDQIRDNAGQLYSGTRDILWTLKPSNDNLFEVLERINEFGHDLFGDTEITFIGAVAEDSWTQYYIPMDAARNLMMIFKEAMNNGLKYAAASQVSLSTTMDANKQLTITLIDNGKGFDEATIKKGHGLVNMQVRAKRLNGTITINSKPGAGTITTLQFKITPNKG